MKLLTVAACKRLAILGIILGVALVWSYLVMIRMPLKSYQGPLPTLTADQKKLSEAMRRDLTVLGGTIGERNVFTAKKLQAATDFVERAFSTLGYHVYRQSFTVMGESCHNLEVEIRGNTQRDEVIVVGAHYDSVAGSPGANDNGSGIVALLALAERLAKIKPARTVRLVAFVNEEPPFFQTNSMGSVVYAKAARAKKERIVAMLSLETLGYYSDAPGSQKYPFPLGLLYPSQGNFVGFVGSTTCRKLVRSCVATWRREVPFPSEGGALPGGIPGIGWSDHWAFWQEGYPALMITDTAPFRYPHYHTALDTPDKVDYERLARVVEGIEKVICSLATAEK